jgi:hypothetical protein
MWQDEQWARTSAQGTVIIIIIFRQTEVHVRERANKILRAILVYPKTDLRNTKNVK